MRPLLLCHGSNRLFCVSSLSKVKPQSLSMNFFDDPAGLVPISSAISLAIEFIISNYADSKEFVKDSGVTEKLRILLPSAIKGNEVDTLKYDMIVEEGIYVDRPSLVSNIINILERKRATEKYDIIYGSKGIGKSTIIERAIHGRKGVVMMKITTAFNRNEVMKQLGIVTNTAKFEPDSDDFIASLRKGKSSEGVLPTIVVEIERAGTEDKSLGIHAVRGVAKDLCAACNFIIILSEANDVLEFGYDKSCENYIFIDELTEQEAREFLNMLGLKLSEEDIVYIIDNIGKNPAVLKDMQGWIITGKKTVNSFVEKTLADARQELVDFTHQQILKALKENPEGVPPEYFKKLKNDGVDLSKPRAVGVAMKGSNAVAYRIELGTYVIISRRHQVALRTYEPILPVVN